MTPDCFEKGRGREIERERLKGTKIVSKIRIPDSVGSYQIDVFSFMCDEHRQK